MTADNIEQRVDELLARMTLREKIHQLSSLAPWVSGRTWSEILLDGKGRFSPAKAKRFISKHGIGGLTCLVHNLKPRHAARVINAVQRFVKKHTRLGIPVLIHDEALHGLTAVGSTAFPQSTGLAAMWDPGLMRRVGVVIGREARARGVRQILAPTVNITRDVRCGRTEETYGEDPYLVSRKAVAYVKGVQSQGVACTLKHFAANFVGDGGRDSAAIELSERMLREVCFPAFRAAVEEAGALGVMAAYNSVDGSPCTSNRWLLTDVLRGEWGFRGIVVADYLSVDQVHNCHCVAASPADAGRQSVEAGMDVELPHFVCFKEMIELASRGGVSIEAIDTAVRNVLRVKALTGVLDDASASPPEVSRVTRCAAHRALALKTAQKAIVLLKNEDDLLPLGRDIRTVAVLGPNANEGLLGSYSATGAQGITPLAGLRNRAGKRLTIRYAWGCDASGDDTKGIQKAVRAASGADVAILVAGNRLETEGEGRDRSCLDLPGMQEQLILDVAATGTPVVVVLVTGGAVTMGRWIDKVSAVLYAWYPGEQGGNAIADVLTGRVSPGGRLPFTLPRTASQLPLVYNPKPSGRSSDYWDLRGEQAMFPFGFGLSYTTFTYSNLRVTPRRIAPDGAVKVRVDVRNSGARRGDEVVQLYLSDLQASVVRPVRELKGFRRISLAPGQKRTVEFPLGRKELTMLDRDLNPVVEPGVFEVAVGGHSQAGLRARFEVTGSPGTAGSPNIDKPVTERSQPLIMADGAALKKSRDK